MFDERAYLKKLEGSTPAQLGEMILSDNVSEVRLLQKYFGRQRYARMRSQETGRHTLQAAVRKNLGTVIILPGILGSQLWEAKEEIWLDPWNIIRGHFDQLPLSADGTTAKNIGAPNVLQKYYGEMGKTLYNDGWNPIYFPFDWRLDIAASANLLKQKLAASVDPAEPLRFVAHSMGGLVVRSLLQQDAAIADRLERFIMMGTPNFGSFAIPLLYSGLDSNLKLIALVDLHHKMADLLTIAKTFVGTYQMQPFIGTDDAERLFDIATYGTLNPPQDRFDTAKAFQANLGQAPPLDPKRCTYIAGFNESTPDGILDWNRLTSADGYRMTQAGDGTVPHSLGLIPNLTTYYIHAKHADLPANPQVIAAVNDLLTGGTTNQLPTNFIAERADFIALRLTRQNEQTRLQARVTQLRHEVIAHHASSPNEVSDAELELRTILATGREPTD